MRKPKVNQKTLLSYALLVPAFLICIIFIVYPLLKTFEYSFKPGATMNMEANGELPFSISGYKKALTNIESWKILGKSFIYLFGSLFPSYIIGLGTALLLNKKFKGRHVFRTLTILPWAIPGVVASIMFIWMFDASYGIMNRLLVNLHILDEYRAWFFDENHVMFAVILPTIWKGYPFFTITLLAALQSIPNDLYEAAEVDGCKSVRKFIYVTWPEIKGASVLSLVLNGLWSFRVFDIIYSTTKGGPGTATTTIAIQIYNEAFKYFDINSASVHGIIALVVCAVIVCIFYPQMSGEKD